MFLTCFLSLFIKLGCSPRHGKNRQLVTYEPVEFDTSRKSLIILEESIVYTSNE